MKKTCPKCRQPIPERPVKEDKSRNGVAVTVYRYADGSTAVDAQCQCFGSSSRLHSNERCPLLLRLRAAEGRRS